MIRVLGPPAGPLPRLMDALSGREPDTGPDRAAAPAPETWVMGPCGDISAVESTMSRSMPPSSAARLLVLSLVGAHPDSPAESLRRLWRLEERARGTGLPVLTLRLGPLVGPRSPFWLKLRRRPRLPRGGRKLINPVVEADAVETLVRALDGRVSWEGWYDVAGAEAVTLAELAEWASTADPVSAGPGAWEPPLDVIEAQRPCDSAPWQEHFGIDPTLVSSACREWAG